MAPGTTKRRPAPSLVDARAVARKHPDTFEVPDDSTLDRLRPGDSVKVAVPGERFWARIDRIDPPVLSCTVTSPVKRGRFSEGKAIAVLRKNVYDTRFAARGPQCAVM